MAALKHLTEDQKEDYADLLRHPGVAALLTDVAALVEDIEADVLKLALSPDLSNQAALIYRKARAEGARLLLDAIKRRVHSLRNKAE